MKIFISQTVDGFIAGDGDSLDHLKPFEGNDYGYDAHLASVDAVVIGRKTFDRIYPEHGWTYPANLHGIVMTARALPQGLPDHVGTSRDPQAIFDRYPSAFVDGGAATISQFLDLGLISDATIFKLPVRLGSGVRLFPITQPSLDRWSLQGVKQFPCGTVGLTYAIGGLN